MKAGTIENRRVMKKSPFHKKGAFGLGYCYGTNIPFLVKYSQNSLVEIEEGGIFEKNLYYTRLFNSFTDYCR